MSIGGWCRAKSWQMTCFMNKKQAIRQQNDTPSSCLKGILGGNYQFARAKIIAVGQCTDAAIDGFHIVLLVEKVSKLC